MRSHAQGFPSNSAALSADNFASLFRFSFGPTANRRTTNGADIQQNGEAVDYSGTRVCVKLRGNFHRW